MEKDLKDILGLSYEVATALGKKLGEALNDAIDKMIPTSDESDNKKGGV